MCGLRAPTMFRGDTTLCYWANLNFGASCVSGNGPAPPSRPPRRNTKWLAPATLTFTTARDIAQTMLVASPLGSCVHVSIFLRAVENGFAHFGVIVFSSAVSFFGGTKKKVAYGAQVKRNTYFALPCEQSLCQFGNLVFFEKPPPRKNITKTQRQRVK